ncbi:hypothetical protein A6E02_03065 [Aliivibrio fischeri]|nr:hypothetical protein A6E02_03065 [Aliivibrio fischeri]OED53632.1 hypothetical protein BEI47_17735 [Aliivibrio fischeri]
MNEHDFFTKINNAVLLDYNSFSLWERAFLSDILYKVTYKKCISKKQEALVIKIIEKRLL